MASQTIPHPAGKSAANEQPAEPARPKLGQQEEQQPSATRKAASGTSSGHSTWQQTKSQLTRTAILQAAIDCFYELGYSKTTTENIAKKASVSRGAMLHHFPTRRELIKATVEYLNQLRLEMFAREEFAAQSGAEHTRVEEGIDVYWKLLNTAPFIVFFELKVVARTDPELAEVVEPALQQFESAWYEAAKDVFPDLALSEAFVRANYLTQLMLEGMAVARFTGQPKMPEKMLISWLKRELRRSFQDVLNTVKRPSEE